MLLPVYKDFYMENVKERYLFFRGSARSGKTFAICQIITGLCMGKKLKVFILTPDYPRQSDIVETFIQASGLNVVGTKDGRMSIFPNGSKIWFRSFDDYAKAKGKEADIMFFNESNDIEFLVVKRLLAGLNIQAFFDYNPTKRFWRHTEPMFNNCKELVTTFRDNIFLPKQLSEEYENDIRIASSAGATALQRWWADVFCLGLDNDSGGLCFPNAKEINKHQYDAINILEVFGTDWGSELATADPDVVIGVKADFTNKKIWACEYYYRNDGTNSDIADVLKQHDGSTVVFETATAGEQRMVNIRKLAGVRLNLYPAQKGAGSVMAQIRELQAWEINICGENFIAEARAYAFGFNGVTIAAEDKSNHAFDALRYVYNYLKQQ